MIYVLIYTQKKRPRKREKISESKAPSVPRDLFYGLPLTRIKVHLIEPIRRAHGGGHGKRGRF